VNSKEKMCYVGNKAKKISLLKLQSVLRRVLRDREERKGRKESVRKKWGRKNGHPYITSNHVAFLF
jgi:hypothetical protein